MAEEAEEGGGLSSALAAEEEGGLIGIPTPAVTEEDEDDASVAAIRYTLEVEDLNLSWGVVEVVDREGATKSETSEADLHTHALLPLPIFIFWVYFRIFCYILLADWLFIYCWFIVKDSVYATICVVPTHQQCVKYVA